MGRVYWLTGLSGAGKSTVAHLLTHRLRTVGRTVLSLDGDILREIFDRQRDHGRDERFALAMSYGRLCREVSAQGIEVVCATVSMFHEVRRWNREQIPGYMEIYLKVPIEELLRRDPKGLYGAYQRGETSDVVGLDVQAEFPEHPDLVIENHTDISPEDAVATIWTTCVEGAPRC
jgi:cytidine diphosphoramidate kinase